MAATNFAVVLIDSTLGMAQHVARRIEAGLQSDAETPPLSVSIGIGLFPDDGRNPQELLEVADRLLYQRKKERKGGITANAGSLGTRRF